MRTKTGPSRYAPALLAQLLLAAPLAAAPACPDPDDPACFADSGWRMCRPPLASPVVRPDPAERLRADLHIDAGRAEYLAGERVELGDRFTMTRLDQVLSADRGDYDRASEVFNAFGDVRYRETGLVMSGDNLHLELDTGAATMDDVRYALPEQHARGIAEYATWDGERLAGFDAGTYTTCDPGDASWLLSAKRVDIDFEEGLGEAEHAVLRFKDVPIFYTPWIQFPVDDRRRSGLLMPSFGHSQDNGFELAVPWYWNIAPNRDATLTPRLMTDRGLQLATEYRYLYPGINGAPTETGQIDVELLPDDDIYGDDRYALKLLHEGRPWAGWQVGVDAGYVSDDDYLRDLGGTLEQTNANYVGREAFVSVSRASWAFRGELRYLQPLIDQRPYQVLPQLTFDYSPYVDSPWRYGVENELVNFDKKDAPGGFEEVTATRLDLKPWVAYRAERSWGYLEPKVALQHTAFALRDELDGSDDSPTRTLPLTSVDGTLFLERPVFEGTFLQTLEPRFFYLYVPEDDDQDDLVRDANGRSVVFDSSLPQFGWGSLFRDNRFSSVDRVGDANQLTLAVTSRFIDNESGVERARLELGQIIYFEDREVTLPGGQPETDETSPVVAMGRASLGGGLNTSAEWVWDPHEETTEVGTFTISYQPELARLVRFSYRSDGDDIEQTDIGFSWPLTPEWQVVGRWNYSLHESTSLETFAGFEYKSCCWAGRIVLREFVRDTDEPDDTDFALMFQLELSGLSRLGDDITGFLRKALPGYVEPEL
jgi:LPS-assembly protein